MTGGSMLTATFKGEDGIHAVSLATYPAPVTVCGRARGDGDSRWDMHGEETWAWTVTCLECIEILGRTQPLKEAQARLEAAMGSGVTALVARVRAALTLIGPDHITPMGARVIKKILDEAEGRDKTS